MAGTPNFEAMASARRANRIADGYETGPVDMTTAQQLGMTLRDASTSEQAKSDHCNFLCGGRWSREIGKAVSATVV